jgi:hypothetical protein
MTPMRKMRAEDVTQPRRGWKLTARRQLVLGGRVYPCGCEVPTAALGKNFRALLEAHYVEWSPPMSGATAKSRAITPTPAAPKAPQVEIIAHSDPVQSWKLSKAALAKALGGDVARAEDLLLKHPDGAALYKLATRLAAEAVRKQQRNRVSIGQETLGL